ncbi:hypothetical protein TSOC_013246, partial [Tetrabaena socialis]
ALKVYTGENLLYIVWLETRAGQRHMVYAGKQWKGQEGKNLRLRDMARRGSRIAGPRQEGVKFLAWQWAQQQRCRMLLQGLLAGRVTTTTQLGVLKRGRRLSSALVQLEILKRRRLS